MLVALLTLLLGLCSSWGCLLWSGALAACAGVASRNSMHTITAAQSLAAQAPFHSRWGGTQDPPLRWAWQHTPAKGKGIKSRAELSVMSGTQDSQ